MREACKIIKIYSTSKLSGSSAIWGWFCVYEEDSYRKSIDKNRRNKFRMYLDINDKNCQVLRSRNQVPFQVMFCVYIFMVAFCILSPRKDSLRKG